MQAVQPELAIEPRLPPVGSHWTQGDGVLCEIYCCWCVSPKNNGVVVRWPKGITGRRARYTVADFFEQFVPFGPDLQSELFGDFIAGGVA